MENTYKQAHDIVGVDGFNKRVLKRILEDNNITGWNSIKQFEDIYIKAFNTTVVISLEDRAEYKELIKKIRKEYAQALIDDKHDTRLKIERDRENQRRTEKAQDSMLLDVQKLVKKYVGLVGESNHLGVNPAADAVLLERKVLTPLIVLIQVAKANSK